MCRWAIFPVHAQRDNPEQLFRFQQQEVRNGIKWWKARLLLSAEQQEAIAGH
jgi:hypothetical protein